MLAASKLEAGEFLRRLATVAKDQAQMIQRVNAQIEVALLLTLPGLVATLTFAPWGIQLMYSSAFVPAWEVLRWQVQGLVLRVLSWPLDFIIIAKGNARVFFGCELAANAVHLVLRLILLTITVASGVFLAVLYMPLFWPLAIGSATVAATGAYSLKTIAGLAGNPATSFGAKLKGKTA